MTKLQALKGSIEKWQGIVNGTENDDGAENCPLCKLYLHADGIDADEDEDEDTCLECPISIKVNDIMCGSTPYQDWANHHINDHECYGFPKIAECYDCKILAQNELDFLKSLLPKEKA